MPQHTQIAIEQPKEMNPPLSTRKVDASKKDFHVCAACCCAVTYCDCDHCLPMCHGQEQLCCCARDTLCCFGEDPQLASMFGCFGFSCYPKFGCCQLLGHYYPPDEYPLLAPKKDYCPCNSCCFGPLCHGTFFFKMPTTCCAQNVYICFKCYNDCALPCNENIPCACGVYPLFLCCGLMCWDGQKFNPACFPKVEKYFQLKEPLVEGAIVAEPGKTE